MELHNIAQELNDKHLKSRVLIVDDSKFALKILNDILSKENLNVVAEAKNGYEAIKLTEKFQPDIIFLDVEMPGMDGISALPKILEANKASYVIMCTAVGQQNIIDKSLKAGAKDCVLKPYKKENIIQVIHSALAQNQEKNKMSFEKSEEEKRISLGKKENQVERDRIITQTEDIKSDNLNTMAKETLLDICDNNLNNYIELTDIDEVDDSDEKYLENEDINFKSVIKFEKYIQTTPINSLMDDADDSLCSLNDSNDLTSTEAELKTVENDTDEYALEKTNDNILEISTVEELKTVANDTDEYALEKTNDNILEISTVEELKTVANDADEYVLEKTKDNIQNPNVNIQQNPNVNIQQNPNVNSSEIIGCELNQISLESFISVNTFQLQLYSNASIYNKNCPDIFNSYELRYIWENRFGYYGDMKILHVETDIIYRFDKLGGNKNVDKNIDLDEEFLTSLINSYFLCNKLINKIDKLEIMQGVIQKGAYRVSACKAMKSYDCNNDIIMSECIYEEIAMEEEIPNALLILLNDVIEHKGRRVLK